MALTAFLGLSASGCESVFYDIPRKASDKVMEMAYSIATLPEEPISWLRDEPSVNTCFESMREKVCRLYFRENEEEYFGVLRIDKGFFHDRQRMILGYFNGDSYTLDGKKVLTVVEYKGKSSEEFIEPHFGKLDYPFEDFTYFFEKPRSRKLDISDNNLERAKIHNLISKIKRAKFLRMLEERIGHALRIMEDNNLYKTKMTNIGN